MTTTKQTFGWLTDERDAIESRVEREDRIADHTLSPTFSLCHFFQNCFVQALPWMIIV